MRALVEREGIVIELALRIRRLSAQAPLVKLVKIPVHLCIRRKADIQLTIATHTIVDHIITEQTENRIKVHQAIHPVLVILTRICQALQRPSRPHAPTVPSTWEVQIQAERLREVASTLTMPSSTHNPTI